MDSLSYPHTQFSLTFVHCATVTMSVLGDTESYFILRFCLQFLIHISITFPQNNTKRKLKAKGLWRCSERVIFTVISITLNPHRNSHWVIAPQTSQIPLMKWIQGLSIQSHFLCLQLELETPLAALKTNTTAVICLTLYRPLHPPQYCICVALGYLTFPFNLEVFVEVVDTFPRTHRVRQT